MVEGQVPGIIPVNFTYDTRGRLSDIVQSTRIYALKYDAQGNAANLTDPLSRTAGFEYDDSGRITKQTLLDGRQVKYTYDPSGNVITITPPGRPGHDFNYTLVDLIKTYIPPDIGIGSTSTSYTYNIDRELIKITRPDGAAIDIGYDSAGRLSTVNYPKKTMSLSYDSVSGNIKTITAPDGGKITYAYDGSLLTDTTWSGAISGNVHRTYNNNFGITSQSVNGGNTIDFQYDTDGLWVRVGQLNLSHDPKNGLPTGSALGNTTDTIGYNSFGEVSSYQAASKGTDIFWVNFTRDNLGRIGKKNETIDGTTHTYAYMYDLAGRLINVSRDGVLVSRYTYDANGNRQSYTGSSGTISGTFDNQDRLMQYGTTTYNYTANGELLSKITGAQTTDYQYDVLGNLMNVTMPDGTKIEYLIDGQNRRIGKKVNGALVQGFLYGDGLRPVAELDGDGNVVNRFVYAGGNVPDYIIRGSVIYRIVIDHLGSPRIVIDASTGAVAQRMDYDEFGNVTSDTNPGFQPFGFAGDYDAQVGRWTVKDPIIFSGGDTNLFGYVLNDPINMIDPSGLLSLEGSAYGGFGGGGKLSITTEGISVCAEVGFGIGAGGSMDPFDDLESDSSTVFSEASAKVGPLSVGIKAELDDCGKATIERKGCLGPLCGKRKTEFGDPFGKEGADHGFEVTNDIFEGIKNMFKSVGAKLEYKVAAAKTCIQIKR
jgi:YD repeat-containing protein